ncbi:MAG: S41 family peptidase [Planctomycetaceae bacterium]
MAIYWKRALVILVCAASISIPSATVQSQERKQDDEYYKLMKVFVETFEQIDRNYVKDVDRRELMEAAIKGMLGRLDQYSSFISPDEVARFNQDVEKQFGGIGIQVHIDPRNGRLTVMTPLPGTPAYKGGVRAGDVILEIEGKSTEGFSIADAVKLLKGEPGEPVRIGVRHLGDDQVQQITVRREIINVATVLGDTYRKDGSWNFMLDDEKKIGYIRLTSFSRRSANELQDALLDLQKHEVKALILDLRFNPGGLLSQATEIADLFVETGKIVSTKGRNTRERVWKATKPGTFSDLPMAILVNHFSASASEIVSACLQDHKRATIVGERTWGKGSVQNVIELEQGSSALKLTTASYHRPSGKNIHRYKESKDTDEWGVTPLKDMRIKFSRSEIQEYLEYRRQRDVLSEDGAAESDYQDRQLQAAIAVILKDLTGDSKSNADTPKNEKPEKSGDDKDQAADKTAAGAKGSNNQTQPETANESSHLLLRLPLRILRYRST